MVDIYINSVFNDKIPDIYKKPQQDKWELLEGTNIHQVLEMLNLSHTLTLLMLNGRQASRDTVLADGDILKIFGVPSGG